MKRRLPWALLALVLAAAWGRPDLERPAPQPRPRKDIGSSPTAELQSEPTGDAVRTSEPEEAVAVQAVECEEYGVGLTCLIQLLERQNADGSWGNGATTILGRGTDRLGITAIATLAFLSAGYSPLSLERYRGHVVGPAVRDSIRWLTEHEPSGTMECALKALALSESYGLLGSESLQEPAQAAVDAVLSCQAGDGSWHDSVWTLWGSMTVYSAQVSGLRVDEDRVSRLKKYVRIAFEAQPDVVTAVAYLHMRPRQAPPNLWTFMEQACELTDPVERYLASILSFHLHRKTLRTPLVPGASADLIALTALANTVYHAYKYFRSVFQPWEAEDE